LAQVLLIATVALLMPRGPPSPGGFHDAVTTHGGGGGKGGGGAKRYAVVIDAGSTGSRVHAFAFASELDGGLDLLGDTFEQLKPGLSSYAAEPAKGAASLKPLLAKAVAAIPASAHASTPVEVRATAGLRMLPGAQAEELLAGALPRGHAARAARAERHRAGRARAPRAAPAPPSASSRTHTHLCARSAPSTHTPSSLHTHSSHAHLIIIILSRHATPRAAVRELLREYPFTFADASVSIMGGADEGAFQWLTLNYLLGNLGGGIKARVHAADEMRARALRRQRVRALTFLSCVFVVLRSARWL
jgi:hypothetical protein